MQQLHLHCSRAVKPRRFHCSAKHTTIPEQTRSKNHPTQAHASLHNHLVHPAANTKGVQRHIGLLICQPLHHVAGLHACRNKCVILEQMAARPSCVGTLCNRFEACEVISRSPRVPGRRRRGHLSAAPAPAAATWQLISRHAAGCVHCRDLTGFARWLSTLGTECTTLHL